MEALVLALVAGALAVDDRAGWQSLIAQPVFAAALVGLIAGEVRAALVVGFVLELIWLAVIPVRGKRRKDMIAGAVVGAGVTCLLLRGTGDPRVAFIAAIGVLIGLLAAEAGSRMSTPFYSRLDRLLAHLHLSPGSSGDRTAGRLLWLHVGAGLYIFLVEAVVVFVLLVVGSVLGQWLARGLGGSLVEGSLHWLYLLPAFGIAALIHLYWLSHLKRILVLSALLAMVVLWMQ